MQSTKVIAITGTIGSGKSLVGELIEERGYPVIDTDKVVHELFENDKTLKQELEKQFGKTIISEDGSVNRATLGAIVFKKQDARKELEAIVHPATIAETKHQVTRLSATNSLIFVLVPLLFEAHQEHNYDEIWTVFAQEDTLRMRLKERNSFTNAEIDQRLNAQLPQSIKVARATHAIDNSGSRHQTSLQVELLLKRLSTNQ